MSHPLIIGDKIWCPFCKSYSKFIQIRNAAKLADVHRRTIHRYIEEGKVYVVKVAGTSYRVCSGCLVNPDTTLERKLTR